MIVLVTEQIPPLPAIIRPLVDLSGVEFQNSDGSYNTQVILENVGLSLAHIKAVKPDLSDFPGNNQGFFNLLPGKRLEMNFKFPVILQFIHGGSEYNDISIPTYFGCNVAVAAYKL